MTAKQIQRALDHYVLQVHDVDAAGGSFERLGFQVRPRMTHIEFGTSNRVVQFRNTYLELLGGLKTAPSDIVKEYLPRFECGEGLSHVSLRSCDLEADHRAAVELGLNPGKLTSARREVVMPDRISGGNRQRLLLHVVAGTPLPVPVPVRASQARDHLDSRNTRSIRTPPPIRRG